MARLSETGCEYPLKRRRGRGKEVTEEMDRKGETKKEGEKNRNGKSNKKGREKKKLERRMTDVRHGSGT